MGTIAERLERRLILELLGDVRGRRILDLGCGDGDFAIELARRGADVTGIDASPAMIEDAGRRAESEGVPVDFRPAGAEALPFPTGHFDIVVAVTILCFVADAAPVFREVARVLRPGGALVIGELGKWSSWAAMRRIRAWLGSPLWRKGHFRTGRELHALAHEAGLQPGPVRGAIYFPRLGSVARLMARFDSRISRVTTLGAAFLAFRAAKPVGARSVEGRSGDVPSLPA
nr:class I SAM-dependent methyltransferase [Neoroseomonas eburnea]